MLDLNASPLPDATTALRGAINTLAQSFSGLKTFGDGAEVATGERLGLITGSGDDFFQSAGNGIQAVSATAVYLNTPTVSPWATNTTANGGPSLRWSNVYSVLGNYSGDVTANAFHAAQLIDGGVGLGGSLGLDLAGYTADSGAQTGVRLRAVGAGMGLQVAGSKVVEIVNGFTTVAYFGSSSAAALNVTGTITTSGADALVANGGVFRMRGVAEGPYLYSPSSAQAQFGFGSRYVQFDGVSGAVYADTTNLVKMGTSSLRWSEVNGVLGNFSGVITASAGVALATATNLDFQNGAGNAYMTAGGGAGPIKMALDAANRYQWNTTSYNPDSDGGASLGTASLQWSDVRAQAATVSGLITSSAALNNEAFRMTAGAYMTFDGGTGGTFMYQAAAGTIGFGFGLGSGQGYYLTSSYFTPLQNIGKDLALTGTRWRDFFLGRDFYSTTGSLKSDVADGASAIAWTLNTTAAYSNATAKLLSLQNNAVEKASFDKDGILTAPRGIFTGTGASNALQLSTDGVLHFNGSGQSGASISSDDVDHLNLYASGALIARVSQSLGLSVNNLRSRTATSLALTSTMADGVSAVAAIFDTSAAWSTGGARIASFRNNGGEVVYIGYDGNVASVSGRFQTHSSDQTVPLVLFSYRTASDTTASEAAIKLCGSSGGSYSATDAMVSVQTSAPGGGGAEVWRVDAAGTAFQNALTNLTADATLVISSDKSDGSGNIGVTITNATALGATAKLLSLKNTSSERQAFYGDGDIGFYAGNAAAAATAGGLLHTDVSTVGNVGTGEDTLHTWDLPANTLTEDGRGIRWVAAGAFATNANSKTLKVIFGGETGGLLFNKALPTGVSGFWRMDATIVRSSSGNQRATAILTVHDSGGTVNTYLAQGTATARTDSAAISLYCTATATTNDDVTETLSTVEWL